MFKNRTKQFTAALIAVFLVSSISLSQVYAQGPGGNPPNGTPPAGGNPPNGTPPDGAAPGAPPDGGGAQDSGSNPVLTATCGVYTLDGEAANSTDAVYDSTEDDQSDICLINGATLTLVNPTITKTGDSSSSDQSSFYGLNAGVLVGSGSALTMTGGTVTTDGIGTNGVFATGEGSVVTLTDVTIYAVGDGAHGVMATLGGAMTLTNVDITTTDAHSGAIATDRGSGTITATGGTILATGPDSPGIYSTGVITVSDAVVTATGAESVVIEGANSVTLTDSKVSSSFADKWGVMIYQSFSGDAEGSEGVFTMTGGSLANTAATGPLFFITNTLGIITLSDVEVMAGSGILVNASATDRWGTSGANGGTVIFTADGQTLAGDWVADTISSITLTLQNKSALTGAINADNTAQAINVTLDETSTWSLTADSYVSTLVDAAGITDSEVTNIIGNGFNVYYDPNLNPDLNGQTYTLVEGGQLLPME